MIQILVVEDEKAISDLIRLNLTKAGYGVTTAYTGMEAADILETENFDLIILDVMLPELDGFELMEYIRQPLEHTMHKSFAEEKFRHFHQHKIPRSYQ